MYRDRATLLKTYTDGKPWCKDEYDAIMGGSPTLAVMNSTFGAGTAEMIIAAKLCSLNQYSNVRVKITPVQADEMAMAIVADPDLKGIKGDILAMFFERLKTGAFGDLYNIVDAVSISTRLRQFWNDCETKRKIWADNLEQERIEKEMEEHRKKAITFGQFKQTEAYKRIMLEQGQDGMPKNI